jgi:hypothetical protein
MTDIIQEPASTWCVWTKTGNRPERFHANKRLAIREAARLARLSPGQKYIVMRMVAKVSVEAEGGAV